MKKMFNKWTKNRPNQKNNEPREPLEQVILQVRPVTKVTKGGRQRRFTVLVLVKKGKGIAFGYARGKDVITAIKGAVKKAVKNLVTYFAETPRTIPYDFRHSLNATEVYFRPAPAGSGIIAGGAINSIFKYLGIKDISAKIIGSRNKLNVVKCTFEALDRITNRRNNW